MAICRQERRLSESENQLFVKNGRGEPFCFRRLGGCFPLKSLNPYSRAASAAMITLPDFDISCGSECNEAIARPENLGVWWGARDGALWNDRYHPAQCAARALRQLRDLSCFWIRFRVQGGLSANKK
jgi:hypothetical protein